MIMDIKSKKAVILRAIEKLEKKHKVTLDIGFGKVDPPIMIDTPFTTLNTLIGGIPRGKFGVIAGPSMTAKTTLMLQIIAYNQQLDPNFLALWTDAEEALDEPWCVQLGIDLDRLLIHKYSKKYEEAFAEALLDQGIALCRTNQIDMWVIDSIGALIPKAEAMKDIEENAMLDLQRKFGIFFRKGIVAIKPDKSIDWPGTAVVLIGQVYNTLSTTGAGLEEVRGGNAVKHWAHWRLKTRRGNREEGPGAIKVVAPDGVTREIRKGWAQHVKLDKTKINALESQEIILQFMNGRGLDSVACAISSLFAHEVFEVGGGGYYRHELFPEDDKGEKKIRSKASVIDFLMEHEDIRNELVNTLDIHLEVQIEFKDK